MVICLICQKRQISLAQRKNKSQFGENVVQLRSDWASGYEGREAIK